MWLVVGGPVVVVVAGLATVGIAVKYPDPVLPRDAMMRQFPAVLMALKTSLADLARKHWLWNAIHPREKLTEGSVGGCLGVGEGHRSQSVRPQDANVSLPRLDQTIFNKLRKRAAHGFEFQAQKATDFIARHAQYELGRRKSTLLQTVQSG